jgi:hypothetical protein
VEEGFAHCTESIVHCMAGSARMAGSAHMVGSDHMVGSAHMGGFVRTAAVGCTSAANCTVDPVLDSEVHLAAKERCWYRMGALD